MAARSSWKGFIKLGLLTVPVKAYSAGVTGAEIKLNQLHADCHARIQYKKSCPTHGEVQQSSIVSAYEYGKGQYVVIDTSELDKLRTEDDKSVQIDTFVDAAQVDPLYLEGKVSYLVPDGPVGVKPYSVLHAAMAKSHKAAIARVVLHNKEQLVLLRATDHLLVMHSLKYDFEVSKPSAFKDEVPEIPVAPEELQLAQMLIDATSQPAFDLSSYKDLYTERLTKLIEAKVAGKDVVAAPPTVEHGQVIDLMAALKQSVAQLKKPAAPAAPEPVVEKPPQKMAASKPSKTAAPRKKKSQ